MSLPVCVYTWVFVRGDEELRIIRPTPVRLVVSSPDAEPRTVDFDTNVALLEYQLEFESHLIGTGWHLEAFSPERRTGHDRRQAPRPDSPDRRVHRSSPKT